MDPASGRRSMSRSLWLLCAVLFWFNTGIEAVRMADWDQIKSHPGMVLSPPWNLLRAYVSREGDDHLYYEYSRLALGQEADLAYIARRHEGNSEALRQKLQRELGPGAGGRLPYRDFPFEYPPVPLLVMLAPRVLADTLPAYRLGFGALMALLALGTVLIGRRIARRIAPGHDQTVAGRLAWLVLAIGPILVSRFDILPAFLTAGALLLWSSGRPARAGLVLGLAVMTKLYPALLLVPWAAQSLARGRDGRREGLKLALGTLLGASAVALPFLVLCPDPFAKSVLLYGARPFQIESLPGGVFLALRGGASVVSSFGSLNVLAPGTLVRLWSLALPAALGTLVLAAFLQERRDPSRDAGARLARVCAHGAAALVAVLCTTKVLSPQFMLWMLPLLALLPGRAGARVWHLALAAAVLTQAFYPYLYDDLVAGHPVPLVLLMLRNGALVAAAVAAAGAAWASASTTAALQASAPEVIPRPLAGVGS